MLVKEKMKYNDTTGRPGAIKISRINITVYEQNV